MISQRLRFLAMATGLLPGTSFAAATHVPLKVKTGAWQMTVKTTMSGNPIPAAALAQMPPDRRAKVMAAMQARSGKPTSQMYRECVTAEDLNDPARFGRHDGDSDCSNTVVASTPTMTKLSMVCAGDHARTGTATFQAGSPTAIKVVMDLTGIGGGAKVHVEEAGTWLAASCENPGQSRLFPVATGRRMPGGKSRL